MNRNAVVSLPPPLEFGENPKVFASLYELDIEQTVIFDTSAVLTARRVAEAGSGQADLNNTNSPAMINMIDFSATSFTSEEVQQTNRKNITTKKRNQRNNNNNNNNKTAASDDEDNDEIDEDDKENSTSTQQEHATKEEDANTKLARELLSNMGGRTVAFDRVHSGEQTRTTELVESLLPYALSTGAASLHNSILFVNNFGASESPFQARGRGETSIVYQILANMHPWLRRRSCDLEASLIAWDSWGDAIDLFSARNTAVYEQATRNYSSPFHSGITTPNGNDQGGNENNNNNGNASNFHSSEPLQFTGMNRLFDALCVNKIVMPGEQHHLHGFISSKNANNNNNTNSNNNPTDKNNSSSSIFNQHSTSSRYKTVSDLCDSVERKVSAFRRQIVSSAFSKDASVSSNSNDYRYAICLRLDCVPIGVEADDELTWGTLCLTECSGSMLCQARSSRRGISPSLLSTVKALYLPPDEAPIRLLSTSSSRQDNSSSSSLLYPLQSLAQLPQRPELSLASFVVGPTCTARLAMVLPVPRISYGSSALFVQASVDALCVMARREWITYPEQPPNKTVDTPLKLFAHSFERKVKEATQLRWLSRKYRNCRVGQVLLTSAQNQFELDQKNSRKLSSSDDEEDQVENYEDEMNNNSKITNKRTRMMKTTQRLLKNTKFGNSNNGNDDGGGDEAIPAIDAWIIAMQRRLASLEEVEVEQHLWHAWLEDYREWLLSIPASGTTHSTIIVRGGNSNLDPSSSSSSSKENQNNNSVSNGVAAAPPPASTSAQTISWSERCELLERVVAQQQEEMRRVKRICLRDIENLREEVTILRSQQQHQPQHQSTNNFLGDDGGGIKSSAATMMLMTSSSVPSQSDPTLRELRGILQGFEFDIISLKNNSSSSSIPPEEVQFELNGMIERLKRDVDSVTRPFFSSNNNNNINTNNNNNTNVIISTGDHYVQSSPWVLPKKILEVDQQTVFRHERLRLRALAGALARGCDDLASRIRSVVELNTNNQPNSLPQSVSTSDGNKKAPRFEENEEYFASQHQNNIISNNNNQRTNNNNSFGNNNNVLRDSDLSPIRDSDGSNYTGAESLMQHWGMNNNNNNNNRNVGKNKDISRPAHVTGNKPFSVNPLARKKYSHSVLSSVHEQWCKDVAATLRNTAENIATDLDGEIVKSGIRQDTAIAELCARFFANRASYTISSFGATSNHSNNNNNQQSDPNAISSSLSKILANNNNNKFNNKANASSTTEKSSGNLNSGRDVIPRINAVNLHVITGNNRLGGGAAGEGAFGSAALRSNRFRKGLFSDPTTPSGGSGGGGAARAVTPKATRR